MTDTVRMSCRGAAQRGGAYSPATMMQSCPLQTFHQLSLCPKGLWAAKSSLDIFCHITLIIFFFLGWGGGWNCRSYRDIRGDESRSRGREYWGVGALHRPINQHHSKGLGLSLYANTHTHTLYLCPLLSNVPLWEWETAKCLIGYFASESIIVPRIEDPAGQ